MNENTPQRHFIAYQIPSIACYPKCGWFNTRDELEVFRFGYTFLYQEDDEWRRNKAQRKHDGKREG